MLSLLVKSMKEIRNSDNKLVAVFDGESLIIVRRNCETRISLNNDGTITVAHIKVPKATFIST